MCSATFLRKGGDSRRRGSGSMPSRRPTPTLPTPPNVQRECAKSLSGASREERAMKSKLLSNEAARVFAVIFDKGDEVVSTLTAFAHDTGLAATRVTAIGAFSHAPSG